MLKTAFSYAVEWGLILKSPIPREAPKATPEERAIWDEKTMLATLQTMNDPLLHLAVHLSMILSLRAGEILGLQPGDIDFDTADGRGTITVGRSLQHTEKAALEKTDPNQIYHIFPDQREVNTGHATTGILMDTYAHTQDRPRLELAEKLEADFYTQEIGNAAPAPEKQNLPNCTEVTPEVILKVVRQMNPEQRREFTRLLFA